MAVSVTWSKAVFKIIAPALPVTLSGSPSDCRNPMGNSTPAVRIVVGSFKFVTVFRPKPLTVIRSLALIVIVPASPAPKVEELISAPSSRVSWGVLIVTLPALPAALTLEEAIRLVVKILSSEEFGLEPTSTKSLALMRISPAEPEPLLTLLIKEAS